ncbi:WD40 repeat-containing protein [Tieghemostelium lacteum]|uniref:WD40 repeat-containing protein n=1 Tax=Tieghemostelium lacteum TaxID=361077 RepID=A0A151Z640_TIELA|nr:WD40 repeat-containing protein [Tieghemostelium lacteum]|eukprot:KYQ89274.1 WD40 repeat-containing protein [Tieghemostelium lacteum]
MNRNNRNTIPNKKVKEIEKQDEKEQNQWDENDSDNETPQTNRDEDSNIDEEEQETNNKSKKRSFSEFQMERKQQEADDGSDDEDEDDKEDDYKFTTKKDTKGPVGKKVPMGARKYLKGEIVQATGIKNPTLKSRVKHINSLKVEAAKSLMKSEILLESERGFIEADEGEKTYNYRQSEIVKNVDIQSSAKVFDLNLQPNGPFSFDFTSEGRYLLLAGEKGQFAIMDWQRGKKLTERHLYKPIRDACFLHNESMFALAQKKYTYIYSSQGIELHCMKEHFDPMYLQFLRYHFLLVAATHRGELIYEDVSIGKKVSHLHFNRRLTSMTKNPYNAAINLGYENGVVEMFIPNSKKPVVKVLCHKTPVNAMAVSLNGNFMVTGGSDCMVKVFDLRNTYKELHSFRTKSSINSLALSDTNVLSVATHDNMNILWKNPFDTANNEPYLRHKTLSPVKQVKFCPFEDILGIGTQQGYSSILVPGSGQPNYDSNEADPFATKKEKREKEITALLEKIPHTMISLDPNVIGTIQENVQTDEQKFKRKDRAIVDKNRIPIDPEKLEEMKKQNKERKEKKHKDIMDDTHRSALSRFENKK